MDYTVHQTIYDFAAEKLKSDQPFELMVDYYLAFMGENSRNYEEITKETTELVILLKPKILPNQMVVTSLP